MKRKEDILNERGRKLLEEAMNCWDTGKKMRRDRRRAKDFAFGRHWDDVVEGKERKMSERELILSQGGYPLQNNLLGRIVRHVVGLYRSRAESKDKDLPDLLKKSERNNEAEELYARTMEEFLLSGMAVHRKRFGIREGRAGVWTRVVSPADFFCRRESSDPRSWDLTSVGQLHRIGFGTWCGEFVKTKEDYLRALRIFPEGKGTVRLAEIWRRERRPRLLIHDPQQGVLRKEEAWSKPRFGERSLWMLDDVWRYYFITERGEIISEGDSPYAFGGHPYIVRAYPMVDGEIHSFVADLIDQQKYANRLITLYDWSVRASAKGVLLVPEQSVEPGRLAEVAESWSRFDGVISYKGKAGEPEPHQVSSSMSHPGIAQLLEIQLKMLEDVSGVTGTLQGNLSASTVSGSLYSQQTENALTSLRDLLESFDSFKEECRRKEMEMIRQFG